MILIMGLTPKFITWLFLLSLFTAIPLTSSQPQAPPPISPEANLCNGVFLSYTYSTGTKIKPNDTKNQPYRFESVITVLNNGREEFKSWLVFVGFAHREILVSATNAVLVDGSSLPVSVENGTTFAGYPAADLKSAIMTAGDVTQMEARVELVGTQFGVAPPNVPLPKNITLANDGWNCPKATQQGNNVLQVCCMPDPKKKTDPIGLKFLPRQKGDLTIMYDVTRAYASTYWAQVTIENHNPLGRLDNWDLSFAWMNDEFIFTTKGAYPSIVDSSDCIDGPQSKYYGSTIDFSNVLSCARRPHIIDLPLTKYNDSELGLKPYCCRNGTILPPSMDPTKSKSVFQMEVYKMPPNLNISAITPPQSWQIKGNLNPDYKCGPPVRVSSSQFPDPSGLPSNRTAFASWQVVCNITQPRIPSCCVSFSSYFNDSIIPCKTCACGGCSSDRVDRTCSTTAPALLLPPQALLIPFENRTKHAKSWADIKHRRVPDPLPCGNNCGVSINWHLATDYRRGWSARITIFNWGETNFADWFTAVQMKKAAPGFEKAYSFNGTTVAVNGKNNTVFMEGLPGLNYLVAEVDGKNPSKDFRVPGKQQSVISFTKKLTPGIKVGSGDGFPTKVFFNGQECSLPSVRPTSNGHKGHISTFLLMALPFLALLILQI